MKFASCKKRATLTEPTLRSNWVATPRLRCCASRKSICSGWCSFAPPQVFTRSISGCRPFIKSYGVDDALQIGLYSVVPWGAAAIATILIARHSDRTGERRWHFAATAFAGAAGLALSTIPHLSLLAALLFLSLGTIGVSATLPVFWSMPSAFIAAPLVAGGLALINSLGVTSGIVSPFAMGLLKQATGSLTSGPLFPRRGPVLWRTYPAGHCCQACNSARRRIRTIRIGCAYRRDGSASPGRNLKTRVSCRQLKVGKLMMDVKNEFPPAIKGSQST